MINEQERLIVLGQLTPNKSLTTLNKTHKKFFNNAKGSNSSNTNSGHASHASNENSKQKKVLILVNIVVKLTILKRIVLKQHV